jgi:SWI/SNF-related matrix-associated actin-dependent regulator 1 of chromatin subfamily A
MPSLIRAAPDHVRGLVYLRFGYDPSIIERLKEIPGAKWHADAKRWTLPLDVWEAGAAAQFPHDIEAVTRFTAPTLDPHFGKTLRDYQQEGARLMLSRPGFLLTMQMRTGKTPTSIAAAASAQAAGKVQTVIVCYPAGVAGEWERQLQKFSNIPLVRLTSYEDLDPAEITRLRAQPFLWVGCHYEILDQRYRDLHRLVEGRQFAILSDEIHACKNRKAGRTKALRSLASAYFGRAEFGTGEDAATIPSGHCVYRWGVTGTPMRNRPRDLFSIFDFIQPGGMGGYWTFAKRYCAAFKDTYGWNDDGESNEAELAARLKWNSYTVTRAQVASHLPKSERQVIACDMREADAKKYRKLEKQLASTVAAAVHGGGDPDSGAARDALKALALATSMSKIQTAVERLAYHTSRGVKVLAFANYHETLSALDTALDTWNKAAADVGDTVPPHFCAGGWLTPAKRQEVVKKWREIHGPAILLVNTLSSGVGIDLSDADGSVFLELAWVPADFLQAEDRIQDVHQGKRVTPPWYEYLLVRETIDEAMAAALLKKIRSIDKVVGGTVESGMVASTLRGSEVVGAAHLGLASTDAETVQATLLAVRDRWLSGSGDTPKVDDTAALLAEISSSFDDAETQPEEY